MRLDQIGTPNVLKTLSIEELEDLASQIRTELVSTVSKTGGHLASNLGVVELTLALHRVFNMPADKLIFDVGHQSYVHKLLTGRYDRFHTLRSYGGLSGFPKRDESEYDAFETGHASTAISAALGMARARDMQQQDHQVIALVGDGALTGGMCYEALNDAGNSKTRMIVILNDNEMSIARNVGALSRHLTDLRASRGWKEAKVAVRSGLSAIPLIGKPLANLTSWLKDAVKSIFVDEQRFGGIAHGKVLRLAVNCYLDSLRNIAFAVNIHMTQAIRMTEHGNFAVLHDIAHKRIASARNDQINQIVLLEHFLNILARMQQRTPAFGKADLN